MLEMAPSGDRTYRQGYAGDTFNTIWHLAQLLDGRSSAGFVTRVGTDRFSEGFVHEMVADGLDISGVVRDRVRGMGLYLIELEGGERSFHYWRQHSAARHLADDAHQLQASFEGAGLIYLSGVTLAILAPEAREHMLSALAAARLEGPLISFDPNIRLQLWSSQDEARAAISQMAETTDIALPSFDDEATLWGDSSPADTISRLQAHGVAEIIVKNGAKAVHYACDGVSRCVATPHVHGVRDTTGAGDAFNAGYLAARLVGLEVRSAIGLGQRLSAEVIVTYGARAERESARMIGRSALA